VGRRTRARECALQLLYQHELTDAPLDQALEAFWRLRSTVDATRVLVERLVHGVFEHRVEIDAAIQEASLNWRLERLGAVDRCILRVATYELLYEAQTPVAVIINEAIELAKRFCEADAHAFVNGVLDAIGRRGRAGVAAETPQSRHEQE
jgi:transcription antitermination protein NusB